ncbi:unnamed protein product [Ceutorhynchus assimilis]|uniref:Nuclear pore complex protein Nup155 n=1 Tax=Ceutorhynchus assimilis TaxID=467358 RepID=A0A9N9MHV5_9CUCU|nr:unnamed protein product [Ceutorhynchus assimilis]
MINTSSTMNSTQKSQNTQFPLPKMEVAASQIDKALAEDACAPKLIDLMNINAETGPTYTGFVDSDYPVLSNNDMHNMALGDLVQIKNVSSNPLPPGISDHFSQAQYQCTMGLFPEINRAWLIADSDLYIWTYETNIDMAYFDGISQTILCVGLVKPKPGVLHEFIKYLLVVATATDIIVLGVTFTEAKYGVEEEMHLIPDPVFSISTDGNTITTITAANNGRIFFGTKEGSLFEITYQTASGWFGKRCKIVNLSTSRLSFLVPSFINAALGEEDGIFQIVIDKSRNILYTLTEKGAIEVCDLGERGNSFSRIIKLSQKSIVHQVLHTVTTLDSGAFRPIVSIAPIEAYESTNLNLVAITKSGVRFYFTVTGLSYQQPNARPYALTLAHVRLPPGFSANITVRPRDVHIGYYRDRNAILLTTVNHKDVLWCLSSDLFPFSYNLKEAYTTINLDAPALAMAEIRHEDFLHLNPQNEEEPPLVVRQHAEAPKKYVVLTSHSVQVFIKLRPVDMLKQILLDSNGQDTLPLTTFFSIQSEVQACATSLILASLLSEENVEIAELATRAFFLFGGEPQLIQANQQNIHQQNTTLLGSTMFSPQIISTPAPQNQQYHMQRTQSPPGYMFNVTQRPQIGSYVAERPQSPNYMTTGSVMQQQQQQSFVQPFDPSIFINFSHKHNGLYLYLCRILRLIWNRHCVERFCPDGEFALFQSSISVEDCIKLQNNLNALHNFLTLNTDFSGTTNQMAIHNSTLNQTLVRQPVTLQDAQLIERKSLDALKTFLCHCCQIMGLWRILCDHQFHELVACLPDNDQEILQKTTFKELFLFRKDICTVLIQTLVNSYLGDNASVDAISNRLMEVCPHLYKPEDAAFTKASELLKTTRGIQNVDEREEKLLTALQLCKNIAPNVKLPVVCKQFTALKAYKAVIELCAYCARRIDPDNIAKSYFHSEDDDADEDGLKMYHKRMETYREIIVMLETLYCEQDPVQPATYDPDLTNTRSILLDGTEGPKLGESINDIIQTILFYDDEIMHVAVYEWMVSRQMTSDILQIKARSLELYLKKASMQNPNNLVVMNLLWQYYETNSNHALAAKILHNLASRTDINIPLKERLTYLARAIMCMRCDKTGYSVDSGMFLRDLEDKIEVAKVQNLILEDITNFRTQIATADEAISALNSGLYEISQLYENFAEPFNLLECKLAIIDCAGYTDNNNALATSIWQEILANELRKTTTGGADRIKPILQKVKNLARLYGSSDNSFPLSYITSELEMINAKLRGPKGLVPNTFIEVNIDFQRLIEVYSSLLNLSGNLNFWQNEDHEFHLCESTCALVMSFINNHNAFSSIEKRKIVATCQDTMTTLLSNLYTKANSDALVNQVRNIQTKLSRI